MRAQRSPELRPQVAVGQHKGRRVLAACLLGTPEDGSPRGQLCTVGSVQLALLTGVMRQWLADPEYVPTGAEVIAGLRAIVAGLTPDGDE